jgi:hypothetical protein
MKVLAQSKQRLVPDGDRPQAVSSHNRLVFEHVNRLAAPLHITLYFTDRNSYIINGVAGNVLKVMSV